MSWRLKIQSFLYPSPLAVFGGDDRLWAVERIKAALGLDEIDPAAVDANEQARGLDLILPDDVATDSLRPTDKLIVRHPLSGREVAFPLGDFDPRRPEALRAAHELVVGAIGRLRESVCGAGFPDTEDQHKRLYFRLWRCLLPAIKRQELANASPGRLQHLWDVLPYDVRCPHATVWDQAVIAAALAGAGPRPSLVLFDVASVQSFLAMARRTQDLWAGSFLVSYLVWSAIRAVVDRHGPDSVLFPNLRDTPLVDRWLAEAQLVPEDLLPGASQNSERLSIGSFPERVTLIVAGEVANEIGPLMRQTFLDTWTEIAGQVQAKVERAIREGVVPPRLRGTWDPRHDAAWTERWQRDIADAWTDGAMFWVTCPWPTDETQYGRLRTACGQLDPGFRPGSRREAAEGQWAEAIGQAGRTPTLGAGYPLVSLLAGRSLVARKLCREFKAADSPGDFHCSLSGQHPAVHPDEATLRDWYRETRDYGGRVRDFWLALAAVDRDAPGDIKFLGRLRRGEQLSAVSLVKRLALQEYFVRKQILPDYHLFPSTASIATAPFKALVLQHYEAVKTEVANYLKAVRKFLPSGLQYPSSILPGLRRIARQQGIDTDESVLEFLSLDGDWLYAESFDEERLRRELGERGKDGKSVAAFDPQRLRTALEALDALLGKVREVAKAAGRDCEPGRHFVIVAMDGDKLGEWIAGARGPGLLQAFHPGLESVVRRQFGDNDRQPLTLTRHVAISAMLRGFSQELVPEIVECRHLGKVIFSGGDDVLAILPLDELLSVIEALRRAFVGLPLAAEVGAHGVPALKLDLEHGFGTVQPRNDPDTAPYTLVLGGTAPRTAPVFGFDEELPAQGLTCSVGAVIAHERTPLSYVIEQAMQEALKKGAKETRGRNAFEVRVINRSGSIHACGGRWTLAVDEPDGSGATVRHLQTLLAEMQDGKVSPRLASALARWSEGLGGESAESGAWWHEAASALLPRLVGQHVSGRDGDKAARQRVIDAVAGLLKIQQQWVDERTGLRDGQESAPDRSWDEVCGLVKLVTILQRQ